jgi:ornithine cyclodeaminase/alanine dehydrogenase-like protein (mu-crystallin family)
VPIPEFILYLTENDVQQTLTPAQAVDLAERGIKADAARHVAGDKFYMNVAQAGFIKPFSGYMAGEEYAFVKTFSYFPANAERYNRPTTASMVLLFDAETGLPVCLMEAGWVTALKTGASTAVTASYLARPDARTVLIFGAGTLGRMHLRALSHRFQLGRAWIVDRLPEAAARYAAELGSEMAFPVEAIPLDARQEVVGQADIIITVTTGSQALVERSWLRPGTLIARLGTYQEIALDVITDVDKVVVDKWHYVSSRVPELKTLATEGKFKFRQLHAEWPDIVSGRKPGRESPDEIITFIALGIWGEYAAILPAVYRRAIELGIGTRLPVTV